MDDLISRQVAIDALKDMYYAAEKWGEDASDDVIKARAESCMASLVEMKLRIEKLPSAQRTGRWIEDSGNIACSECHIIWLHRRTAFCPNCGCAMEGEEE